METLKTLNEDKPASNFIDDCEYVTEENPEDIQSGIYDGFKIDAEDLDDEDIRVAFHNLRHHLAPISKGIIKNSKKSFEKVAQEYGFKIVSNSHSTLLIKKESADRTAVVSIYNAVDEKAKFVCDVAQTIQDKIRGLQGYKKLASSTGMIFPYAHPQNVLYHMGTVSFPIDIIFVGSDNKIKRAYKNIQPGTIATFGCSEVSNVIEVSGGLCDYLGIGTGDKIKVEKISPEIQAKFLKAANHSKLPVFSTIKTASYKRLPCGADIVSPNQKQLIKKTASNDKDISAYYIDALLDLNLQGDISLANARRTLRNFISKEGVLSSDGLKILKQLKKDLDSGNKIAVVSKYKRLADATLTEAILTKVSFELSNTLTDNANIEVIYVKDSYDQDDILDLLESRYKRNDIKVYSDSRSNRMLTESGLLLKQAGTPVPEDIKAQAKKALAFIERAKNQSVDLIDKLKHNVDQYAQIQGEIEVIKSSKGQFNESIKRNSEFVKNMLMNVRDSMKIMNEIKDVSRTSEIIDSLAQSSKKTSDSIEEIFETINIIDTEEFYNKLALKTGALERAVIDLQAVMDRLMEHINSDILGLMILSS